MTEHLKKYPLTMQTLENRHNLVKWGIDFHNAINYYTGKSMLTYSEAMMEINKLMEPEQSNLCKYLSYLLVFIIIIIICYLIYYYYRLKKSC